jgi:Arc/MetJ-type ribon-helix-helix transcriptional regulator
VEQATLGRVQRMIDAKAAEWFPANAMPRLMLLHYGGHPVIEPGELYLGVILGRECGPRDAWLEEHGDRLGDFRDQRLPQARGFLITDDDPGAAGFRATGIMKVDGDSLLDAGEDEIARGLTPVMCRLGPADLETLDALITAGIAASRAESVRWALARVPEQPAHARFRERPPGGASAAAGMEAAVRDRLQGMLDEQVKGRFPDGGVERVVVLRYGDDPWVEPGGLLVRVSVAAVPGADPNLRAWQRDHEAMISDLHREVREKVPAAGYLELLLGEDGRQGRLMLRLAGQAGDPAGHQPELTSVDAALGPADLAMLDALITAGITGSRRDAIRWALARIRERPAYARLSERARELDDLKARF